ncbi:MAG TPA: hypothetical protein PKD34_03165 [Candidatus Doudnabacteria bacterium]|nr:hypothetical protein [Candidatus Doudnabacteria bacterium]
MKEHTKEYRLQGGQIFPKASMLVLHHRDSNRTQVELIFHNRFPGYVDSLDLITSVPVSEFGPYFMLYPDEIQEGLFAEIIQVVGMATSFGKKYRKVEKKYFPKAFKRLAKKLIRAYRKNMGEDFLTLNFIRKVYAMVRKIWLHSRAYYRWSDSSRKLRSRLQKYRPIESYDFVC